MTSLKRAALRNGPRTRGDVTLAYVRPDTVDGFFFDAVTLMLLHDRDHNQRIGELVGVESGPRISNSRCKVVTVFLEHTDSEWLCWLDSDMVPPADMIDRLLEHADPDDAPIVGALCFAGGRTTMKPTIYTFDNTNGTLESETILSYPPDALIEVGGTGSACVLIHRRVFEAIQAGMPDGYPLPWYQDIIIENKDWGEDLVFCLRAKTFAHARIWIHTGVKVGHRKKWTMDESAYVRYAEKLDEIAGGPTHYTDETLPKVDLAEVIA